MPLTRDPKREAKTVRIQLRNRQFNNISWRFQHPTSIMDRLTRQKINEEIKDLNNPINQLDLTDSYRILHYQ